MQFSFSIFLVIPLICLDQCINRKVRTSDTNLVKIWYGPEQVFGKNGNPQRQINILGNIKPGPDIKAFYTLNDSAIPGYLTLGCDMHRLAGDGDFNIEIDRSGLKPGKNEVHLYVIRYGKILDQQKITIRYIPARKWPLPYHVRWKDVLNIQDAVEITDGDWEITGSGIHTKHAYYDRMIVFGDSSWKNYEVETTVSFHGYNPPAPGPPSYNVSHVAIASRWPGHDKDTLQPNRKWYPLGATSEFRITDHYDSCRWRIFDGENFYREQDVSDYRRIQPNTPYKIKHRVEDISQNETRYSVKLWLSSEAEPSEWDFLAVEISETKESGSACLIAHHTDVTFGNVSVIPLDKGLNE